MNKSAKHVLKLLWTGLDYEEQKIHLEPYMLGLWLGDGTSSTTAITNIDEEILTYMRNFADEHELIMKSKGKEKNSITYSLVRKYKDSSHENYLLKNLQNYDVINNKHIPIQYKTNSRNIRLQLLAGLIDSDGYYKNGCYEITQKNKRLAQDIVDICRSLGFGTFVKECQKSCKYNER